MEVWVMKIFFWTALFLLPSVLPFEVQMGAMKRDAICN